MTSSGKRRRSREQNLSESPAVGVESPAVEAPKVPSQASFELDRIGDILRRVREQRGGQIELIAEQLCIRTSFLVALENNKYEELPADAYVVGFLRTYANYLGLDGKAAIDQYRREMEGRRRKPQLNMPQPLSEGRAPTTAILIASLIGALLVYALWYGLSTADRAVVSAPPALPSVAATETPENAASDASATAPAPTPEVSAVGQDAATTSSTSVLALPSGAPMTADTALAPAKEAPKGQVYGDGAATARLVVKVEKESWVLITDKDGKTLFDHTLKAGDIYKVPNMKGLSLTTGNGSGIVLNLDGADLSRLADDARIVRNFALDVEALKARAAGPLTDR